MKTENGCEEAPFESKKVYCGPKTQTNQQEDQFDSLKEQKEQLVKDLIAAKEENQKLYTENKVNKGNLVICGNAQGRLQHENSEQQKVIERLNRNLETINLEHETEINRFKEQSIEQQKTIGQLTRDKKMLEAKIKQLTANVANSKEPFKVTK